MISEKVDQDTTLNADMLRISIVGTSGSGKTTFARRLAGILALPRVELDAIFWQPNWTELPEEEFHTRVALATEQDRWVIEGNYSRVRNMVWSRATHVIWLNYPFLTVFTRVLYRTISRIITQEELFTGCRESFKMTFLSRESILLWMITTYGRRKRQYRALFAQNEFSHLTMIELHNQRQADRFLASLQK
jgi:adenylate kinase family enzyme